LSNGVYKKQSKNRIKAKQKKNNDKTLEKLLDDLIVQMSSTRIFELKIRQQIPSVVKLFPNKKLVDIT
jgi:hypothetical protein